MQPSPLVFARLTASKSLDRAPLCLRFSPCQPGKSGADMTASLSSCGPWRHRRHRLAYGAISNNALCKNQEVDGRRRFYEPLATNHEPLSLPARQIRRGSDRVIELLRSLVTWALPPCIWCHIEPCLTQKPCRGAHVGRPLRATSHEPRATVSPGPANPVRI